uniref:helicase protein MOM1-like isoform X2 n=1 Tax=Fragaria vesca subsp. vesca TaxID=101020 RepID=UPI0005CB01FD|nr:PREDICTED: helicase protein MOM1-like isoform X2 [Fragaria vesca subsp. vesca]
MQKNMAHDTRSSRKVKDDESNNSIGRQISSKGSSTSGSSTSDTPVLRRSSRETLLKKNNTLSPSSTRKSEQLEKPIPETPPAKKKSEIVENKSTPSPLRRSERGKTHSSTSSASKTSNNSLDSLLMKGIREKKEKTVKELTLGTKELCKSEKQNVGHGLVKQKRLNSRAYIASLLKHAKAPDHVPKQSDELTLQPCHNAITEDIDHVSERVHVDGTALKTPELTTSTSNGRISAVHTGLEDSDCITPSKRKRKMADGSDSSGVNASKDVCTVVDTGSALPSGCTGNVSVETCGICFKRQRVDNDPMKQESCSCGTKLNQEFSGGANKKELSADLQSNGEENSQNTCLICTFGGKLLCCDGKGCKRSYHLSCLDPPMNDAPIGVWHCSVCVQKKIESRILSISDGPESLRNARNLEVSDADDSSRFIEYWVPVEISNVQRELYCEKLLLNPSLLHLSSSKDLVGALPDLLRSTRKCCDHPYIEEASLQEKVMEFEGLQAIDSFEVKKKAMLDAGIKASGKLQLLDMMLMEIKNRGLRALILFQSTGGLGILIGDILDDFLRQRYGEDSYERVEQGVVPAKKGEAMDKFNNKDCGRFVFLLETRACRSSIKLSSVDTIIIFGSDWNPVNDVRALQKISIDSQFEQIKVFRLYSTCTIEEKVLILAKEEKILDSYLHNITKYNCQLLLSWGAPYQFVKLNEFHGNNSPGSSVTPLKDVIQEFVSLLPQDAKNSGFSGFSVITRAHQTGGGYSAKTILFGELKCQHMGDGKPLSFWLKLWEGKHPQWKYCIGLSQRNRKRVKHTDELSKKPQVESDEAVKKRKKVGNSNNDSANLKPGFEGKSTPVSEDGASVTRADHVPRSSSRLSAFVDNESILAIPESDNSEERRKVLDAQKSLHLHLKPEISKLCGILQFSELHKVWVEKFLEYVVKNHNVNRESATILQAFQISVCWTVASILKHKVDHKESFALTKRHLSFNCQKEEVDRVYSMLRCLKKTFLYRTGNFKAADSPNFSELPNNGTISNLQGVKSGVEDYQIYLVKKDLSKCINEIQKKFEKKMKKLLEKQCEERSRVLKFLELEKEQLEKKHKIELAVNRIASVSADRLRIMETDFEKEIEEHKHRVDIQLQVLEKLQLEARLKLKEKENLRVEDVQNWVRDELLNRSPSNAPDEIVACTSPVATVTTPTGPIIPNGALDPMNSEVFYFSGKYKNSISGDNQANVASVIPCAKELMTNGGTSENGEALLDVPEFCSSKVVTPGLPSFEERIDKSDKLPIRDRDVGAEDLVTVGSTDGPLTHSGTEQYPHGAALSMPDREAPLELHETVSSIHGVHNVGSVSPCASEEQIRVVTVNIPGNEVESAVVATVSSNDAVRNLLNRVPTSSEQMIVENPTETESGEVLFTASDVVTGFNQQKGVDNELSSAAQSVANIESEQSDHELATNMPGGPSSETPDPSPQVSSAAGENRVQDTVLATSFTGHDGNAQACEKHITCLPVENLASQNVVIRASDQSDHEELVVQLSNRNELSSACEHQRIENQDSGILLATSATVQGGDGDGRATGNQITCQPLENPVSQSVAIVESDQAVPTNAALVQLQLPPESAAGGIEIQPRREDHTSNQVSHAPMQRVETYSNQSTETTLPPASSLSLHQPIDIPTNGFGLPCSDTRATSATNSRPIHAAPQGTLRMPHYSYPDPLQNELERLNKEMEQNIKSHEDKKLHLKSDYDKKIEEAVAELHRQCETKLQKEEAEFQHKQKELDANHNKVLMNKILAEAFRSKCMDLRASNVCGVQQDGNSTFIQQLVQFTMQQNAQRPSSVSNSSSTSLPAASLQTSISPSPSHQASIVPMLNMQTSSAPSLQTTLPASAIAPSQHYTAPIMQTVPLSHASPSIPARPPHIGTFSGSTGIPQGGGQIRSPAPHLQPFRPSTSVAGTSPLFQQGGMSNPHSHSNSLATSPSLPHMPQMPAPTQQTVPSSGVQHVESAGDSAAPNSASALKLLMDMEKRSGANRQGGLLSLPALDSLNPPGPVFVSSASANPVNTGGIHDIVCLSDDD